MKVIQYILSILPLQRIRSRIIVIIEFLSILSITAVIYLTPIIYLIDPAEFKPLLLTVGGSLIGATAIAFSFVMFAMQINITRLPHNLFKKFSQDTKLFFTFFGIFIASIVIASSSLFIHQDLSHFTVLTPSIGLILIMSLFARAYRRTLYLINPEEQLKTLEKEACKDLKTWERKAQRFKRPGSYTKPQGTAPDPLLQYLYFRGYPHWANEAKQTITDATYYTRRYTENGDYGVARCALRTIVAINRTYTEIIEKVFSIGTKDELINETLETLRQDISIGISRGDEEQIKQTFNAIFDLFQIYLELDYVSGQPLKEQARLAVERLTSAMESIFQHDMPNVLVKGTLLLGECGQRILEKEQEDRSLELTKILGEIRDMSCRALTDKQNHPVARTGMEQFATLTLCLIRGESHNIDFTARILGNSITAVAIRALDSPSMKAKTIPSPHYSEMILSPYYLNTNTTFNALANELMGSPPDDQAAKRIIRHIEQWASESLQIGRVIFPLSLKRKSFSFINITSWIVATTKTLLVVANAPACDTATREKIKRSALSLSQVLDQISNDREAVCFAAPFGIENKWGNIAVNAFHLGNEEITNYACDRLLSWGFIASKYKPGCGTFEKMCYGLATLSILQGQEDSALITKISGPLENNGGVGQEILSQSAQKIREFARSNRDSEYVLYDIERAMREVDQERLNTLLEKIADMLSPEEAN